MSRKKILIVYGYTGYPLRSSIKEHLYSFKNYSDHEYFYVNITFSPIPKKISKINFDLIIFHTTFIASRWSGKEKFNEFSVKRIEALKKHPAPKAMLPQDEWIHTNALNDFTNEFNINYIFSVAPPSEYKKIYSRVDLSKTQIYPVLTGYLDEKNAESIKSLAGGIRKVDIGYRAFPSPAWLGKHGYLKTKIAEVFNKAAKGTSLKTDISTDANKTFFGSDWYKFLLECKYTIGVEGGSTILDPDGTIWKAGTEFVKKHPTAKFEEIEENCFKGMDGNLNLIALSPRHLEACVTKTCQILVEGDYNGVLEKNKHYIPIKPDLSNVEETVKQLTENEELRNKITEQAYNDIVISGRYSYKSFVDFILAKSGLASQPEIDGTNFFSYVYCIFHEKHQWMKYKLSYKTVRQYLENIYIYSGLRFLKQKIRN